MRYAMMISLSGAVPSGARRPVRYITCGWRRSRPRESAGTKNEAGPTDGLRTRPAAVRARSAPLGSAPAGPTQPSVPLACPGAAGGVRVSSITCESRLRVVIGDEVALAEPDGVRGPGREFAQQRCPGRPQIAVRAARLLLDGVDLLPVEDGEVVWIEPQHSARLMPAEQRTAFTMTARGRSQRRARKTTSAAPARCPRRLSRSGVSADARRHSPYGANS